MFQDWHKEFDEIWPAHWKVSKSLILMCSFWAKYILIELKKHRVIIFHETEDGYQIWRGSNFFFQNWRKEFDKISLQHFKVSKILILMCFFWAKYILFEVQKYRGIIFHETEGAYKIWRGLELLYQNWHKEFDKILTQTLQSLKIFHFNELFLCKVYILWAKKVQRNNLSWTWQGIKNLERNQLFVSKLTLGILTKFDLSTWKSQKFSFLCSDF